MNVLTTQFSLETRSLDIYLAGCRGPHCENCHNPESWDFNKGIPWRDALVDINRKINFFPDLIENIMIFGGEPFDQDHEKLETFLVPRPELLGHLALHQVEASGGPAVR